MHSAFMMNYDVAKALIEKCYQVSISVLDVTSEIKLGIVSMLKENKVIAKLRRKISS